MTKPTKQTPTPKSLDEILERFARKVWDPRQREFDYRIRENEYPKFAKAINQLCLSEFLELIGEDEELPVDLEERVYIVPSRNHLRADLRTKALDRWSAK